MLDQSREGNSDADNEIFPKKTACVFTATDKLRVRRNTAKTENFFFRFILTLERCLKNCAHRVESIFKQSKISYFVSIFFDNSN